MLPRLTRWHPAREPNPNPRSLQWSSCCSYGCTAQLVSESAPRASSELPQTQRYGCSKPSFRSSLPVERAAAVWANSARRDSKPVTLVHWEFLPSRIPSSTRVHASGPNRRPAARRRSASTASPLRGLGSSRNKFESRGKERRSNFFRAPPRKHSLALGSRAHSLASRRVTRAGLREIQRNGDHHHVLRTKSPSSASSATTQKFAPTTTAASPLSRWQPRAPTRRTASTSSTPNGTVASSSASSESSPPRSRRALISRSRASCAAASTTARRPTRSRPSGRSG